MTSISGRVVIIRKHKLSIFFDVLAHGDFSVLRCVMPRENYTGNPFSKGDILTVNGIFTKNKNNQDIIEIASFTIDNYCKKNISDSVLDNRGGLLNRPHFRLLVDENYRRFIKDKFQLTYNIRQFLYSRGFTEIEATNIENGITSSTIKAFKLEADFRGEYYLRSVNESTNRRFASYGFNKFFEFYRSYKNRGKSKHYSIESWSIDVSLTYSNSSNLLELLQELFTHAQNGINTQNRLEFPIKTSFFYEHLDDETISAIESMSENEAQDIMVKFYRGKLKPSITSPHIIIGLPIKSSMLAKTMHKSKHFADDFTLIANGSTLVHGATECTDSKEQVSRFGNLIPNYDIKNFTVDERLLDYLDFGCPPLSSMTISLNNLQQYLFNLRHIRETQEL